MKGDLPGLRHVVMRASGLIQAVASDRCVICEAAVSRRLFRREAAEGWPLPVGPRRGVGVGAGVVTHPRACVL